MRSTRMSFVAIAALFLGAGLWPGSPSDGPVAESLPLAASIAGSGSAERAVENREPPAGWAGRPGQLQVIAPQVELADLGEDLSPSEVPRPPELAIPPILPALRN
jgi:hypothetical protein